MLTDRNGKIIPRIARVFIHIYPFFVLICRFVFGSVCVLICVSVCFVGCEKCFMDVVCCCVWKCCWWLWHFWLLFGMGLRDDFRKLQPHYMGKLYD